MIFVIFNGQILTNLNFYLISAVVQKRRPPPFESASHYFEEFDVSKSIRNNSEITYHIKAVPADCGSGFPLLELGFMQVNINK